MLRSQYMDILTNPRTTFVELELGYGVQGLSSDEEGWRGRIEGVRQLQLFRQFTEQRRSECPLTLDSWFAPGSVTKSNRHPKP